jgi:excisionase family DNA binding protein
MNLPPSTGPRKLAYSMASAAVVTDLSEKTVQRAIRSGALRAKKVGRGVRILRLDLEEWLTELPDA